MSGERPYKNIKKSQDLYSLSLLEKVVKSKKPKVKVDKKQAKEAVMQAKHLFEKKWQNHT